MLASSLVALMLACTVIALPPKRQGLAKVYSSCKVPNYVALTFVSIIVPFKPIIQFIIHFLPTG